ncbi:MAG TPA: hypothetical protein VHW00_13555 [Thermoanaerobaculia bacterium]|nr:hypothetical protein [Thermoanaerobaculia bacterium]
MAAGPGGRALSAAARRERLLCLAFAAWGLAIAIALVSLWERPAPAGQLPGLATTLNFDAHGPFRWVAGLMLLPIVFVAALRPLARKLAGAQTWATHAVIAAVLFTFWFVTVSRDPWWAFGAVTIVLVLATLLRNRELAFTRGDAVLVPTFLTAVLALIDALPSLRHDRVMFTAALLVFVLRIAIASIPSAVPACLAFTLAPLGIVFTTGFFARDQRYFGWHALAFVVITPFVLRVTRVAWRKALVLVVYPLALYAYANATSLPTAEGKGRVNFFEDGHSLLPASEYLRGERPYRDVLPAHGLIEDGLFDFVSMQAGDVNVGTTTRTRAIIGNLNAIVLYALAFAVTGSAEGALFAVLLSFMTGTYVLPIRLLPALLMLACIAAAVRWRRPRLLAFAGFMAVLAGATSLDFGFYSVATLAIACIRMRRVREAAIGVACAAIPLFAFLALFGLLDDFVRGTFLETLSAGPAYVLNFFTPPELMKRFPHFPDLFAVLLDRPVFAYVFWCLAALFTAVTITRAPERRLEPLVLLGAFTTLTAISYGERHHLYFAILISIAIVFVAMRLLRARQHALATLVIAAAIVLAGPTTHMGVLGWMRLSRGPVEPNWVEVESLPRARGAWFHAHDAAQIESARKYVSLALAPDETFFDFTNRGILYFLLRRDCPVREYEVAFYETEAGQREIIRRLEANPRIRAALVPTHPKSPYAVDGIPNAERAPLVWQYLQEHFSPDFEEGDVTFWRRK